MADTDRTPVLETTNAVEAELYRGMLEEAEIAVISREMANPWLRNLIISHLVLPRVQLLVAGADAMRAGALVDDYRRQVESGELAPAEEEIGPARVMTVASMLRNIGVTFIAALLIAVLLLYGYSTISRALPHNYPPSPYYEFDPLSNIGF